MVAKNITLQFFLLIKSFIKNTSNLFSIPHIAHSCSKHHEKTPHIILRLKDIASYNINSNNSTYRITENHNLNTSKTFTKLQIQGDGIQNKGEIRGETTNTSTKSPFPPSGSFSFTTDNADGIRVDWFEVNFQQEWRSSKTRTSHKSRQLCSQSFTRGT